MKNKNHHNPANRNITETAINTSWSYLKEIEPDLIEKDVWDGEKDLGLRINKHTSDRFIRFSAFSKKWFEIFVKQYILYRRAQFTSFNTLLTHLDGLKVFEKFLTNQCVNSFEEIDEYLLELYIKSLAHYSVATKRHYIAALKAFLKIGNINQWFDIPTYSLERYRTEQKNQLTIEYIPDDVLQQLDSHLHLLAEPLQRLVIVMRALGLRACEILQIRFDCLRQLRSGDWIIQFTNWKFQEQLDNLPINESLVAIIKEQQKYIVNNLGHDFPYLFCGNKSGSREKTDRTEFSNKFIPTNKVCSLWTFSYFLNKLARYCNICDSDGKIWHFSSHQFRRTVATKMTNEGVRQYIIQSYLRHRSPDMMLYYAQLLPETIKKEMSEFVKQKKIVDITGKEVEQVDSELDNDINLQWLRAKMQPKALAMGFCARPALLKPCPHANACMNCEHFRLNEDDLPALKGHLERTVLLKNESKKMGYIRQIKEIEKAEHQLNNLIENLSDQHE